MSHDMPAQTTLVRTSYTEKNTQSTPTKSSARRWAGGGSPSRQVRLRGHLRPDKHKIYTRSGQVGTKGREPEVRHQAKYDFQIRANWDVFTYTDTQQRVRGQRHTALDVCIYISYVSGKQKQNCIKYYNINKPIILKIII